jgi:AbrB family looped-hinge helix DNA binding protein
MGSVVVKVAADGRMTLPAAIRRALEINDGDAHLSIDVADGAAVLRPAVVIPREDAWAYTPEHLESVRRARAQAATGDLKSMPDDVAEKLGETT